MTRGVSAPRRAGLLLCGALFLAACTGLTTHPAPAQWTAVRASWQGVADWQLSGRLAVRAGDERGQGTLTWRQQGDHYVIFITSPVAQGGISMDVSPQGAQLRTAEGGQRYGDDPEALLATHTGLRLPIAALGNWLRALPQPQFGYHAEWDEQGRLQHLDQRDWDIRYTRYADGTPFPERLQLKGQDVDVRIVVDEWLVPAFKYQ